MTMEETSNAFDSAAVGYDRQFENNRVTASIRPLVWNTLKSHFHPGDHILDLSCGTGTDALYLAGCNVQVTAIDISNVMIDICIAKLKRFPDHHRVKFLRLNMEDIDMEFSGTFDGAYSNFGGLNCLAHLDSMIGKIARSVRPGGIFVACLMNRRSLWETVSFAALGAFGAAFRRWTSEPVTAVVGTRQCSVRYYTVSQIRAMWEPLFEIIGMYGLNILSPPPGSMNFLARYPRAAEALLTFDGSIRAMPLVRTLGDHLVVIARRNS